MKQVSASAISSFMSCQREYAFKYVDRVEPSHKPHYLYRGTAIHECIQAFWARQSYIPALEKFRAEAEARLPDFEYEDFENKEFPFVSNLVRRYVEHYKEPPAGVTVIATEFELSAKLGKDTRLIGYVDLLVSWLDKLWAVEIKTSKSLPRRMGYLEVDPQETCYVWALRKHGIDVAGVLFDGINTYEYAKPDLVPAEKLFIRQNVFRTDEQLAEFERESLLLVKQMERMKREKSWVRNLGNHCGTCAFQKPCWAEWSGMPEQRDRLLAKGFKPREGR